MMKTFEAVGEAGQEALTSDLLGLVAGINRADDGTMVVPSEYLETVIVKGPTTSSHQAADDRVVLAATTG
jgi:hypothetical protein